jgi:phage terminase Nu1 subunit (DNA packaging protein)
MSDDFFLRYYDLETYIFVDVASKFKEQGKLDAFDLFSIINWKAQRANSKLAKRLIAKVGNLELAAEQLTTALFKQPNTPEQRLIIARDD